MVSIMFPNTRGPMDTIGGQIMQIGQSFRKAQHWYTSRKAAPMTLLIFLVDYLILLGERLS